MISSRYSQNEGPLVVDAKAGIMPLYDRIFKNFKIVTSDVGLLNESKIYEV